MQFFGPDVPIRSEKEEKKNPGTKKIIIIYPHSTLLVGGPYYTPYV